MIRAAIAALGMAALLVVFLAHHQEPAAARVDEPLQHAKGDRLPARAAPVAPPPAPIALAPGPADARVGPGTALVGPAPAAPAALVGAPRSAMAAPAPAAPAPVAAAAPRDPVCGTKGRTWYTKQNGWKYWRCNR
jgi:pyruvate dehydrogenase E2 component (dihydrolipoamide acetyltransferase)